MSANAPSLYGQEFATAVQLLLQQKGSRLRGKVMEGPAKGEQSSPVDQVGKIEMQEVTDRFAPITRTDAPVDRRWVFPSSWDLAQLMDPTDEFKILSDPKGKYVMNAVNAAGRQIDRLIIAAMTGTNYTGKTGTTSTVLPSGQKVAVGFKATGNVGMTVAKLKEAKRLLMAAEVDPDEELYCAMTATQLDNLLDEVQVVSTDFNDKPVLVDGRLVRFMGINFVHTELLAVASSIRVNPVWAKSGVHLGIWQDVKSAVTQRDDLKSLPWQAYIQMTFGATRVEETKVVQISSSEA